MRRTYIETIQVNKTGIASPTVPGKRGSVIIRSLMFCCMVFLSVAAKGQHKGYTPVSDVDTFKRIFSAESLKVQSIASDFKQEKTLTALTEKFSSTGKFWFKRSNKVRLDYQKPFIYRMIINGDKLFIKDEEKENRINVKSNKLLQQVNRIMVDCIEGSILQSKDFKTVVYENDKNYLLEMTPVTKTLKDFFQTIVLIVDRKDYAVSAIEMNEAGGDNTVITFQNKIINKSIGDEVFAF